ncbi:MAG: winged helix DNA-binding domain-containing protein [Thermomicrobiales bacterium]
MTAQQAIEYLVALQAQDVMPPYTGLWSRLQKFRPEDINNGLLDRTLVRATSLRPTVHLTTRRDLLKLLPIMLPGYVRMAQAPTSIGGLFSRNDITDVTTWANRLMDDTERGAEEMRERARIDWPEEDPQLLASAVQWILPLCQVPPRGLWKTNARPRWALADQWLGESLDTSCNLEDLILRYIRAFGPMAAGDIQSWSRLTGLKPVIDSLRPQLRTLVDEAGRELLDLPESPWPAESTAAPVRLLGAYDNLWLAHKDRSRILEERHRLLIMNNGIGRPPVLVDGFIAARYRIDVKKHRAILTIQPFRELTVLEQRHVAAEANLLIDWIEPDLDHEVLFNPIIS